MIKSLVIPSCREDQLRDFFLAWRRADWDRIYVVEDNPCRSFDLPPDIQHFCWTDMEADLPDHSWIFSRRDSAIRCFGFWRAWRDGADLIVTLDDDVRPVEPWGRRVCRGHSRALGGHARWVSSVPGFRPRGLPYRDPGRLKVQVNMGLWAGIPDQDAIQSLSRPVIDFIPPSGSWLIPHGQYVPICGMNLSFRREAIPLLYFPLQGEGYPYRRFDDIWMGVICKKVMDHLHWNLSVGDPAVFHARASDPMQNLIKEGPGIVRHETLWQEIDRIELHQVDPVSCVIELGQHLEWNGSDEYLRRVGLALKTWASLFTSAYVPAWSPSSNGDGRI